jgi:hypothetical protein
MSVRRFGLVTLLATAIVLSFTRAPAASCNQQPVSSVSTAHLEFQGSMIAAKVQGMVPSLGWTAPQLQRQAASGDARVLTFTFVACKPIAAARVMTPIEAATVIMANTASPSRIVVSSQTNSITLDVATLRRNPVATPPGNTAPLKSALP